MRTGRPTDLAAFVREGMGLPFDRALGIDCCLWPCDWIEACTGIDPAADLRGRYRNAAGALRLIRAWGGFDVMWRVHMAMAGFNETRAPAPGDVGLVRDMAGQVGAAIRVPGAWAVKATRGVTIEDMPMILAWSIPRG